MEFRPKLVCDDEKELQRLWYEFCAAREALVEFTQKAHLRPVAEESPISDN